MRIRSLKPGFFKNEQLCELSPWHRLCFEGLWLCADREGRLEDRPKRLKAEIFPYDDLNMNGLLWDLMHAGFLIRYQAANLQPLIWIPSWHAHQFPRADEAQSKYPSFEAGQERRDGTDPTSLPSVRPIDTAPSLPSDGPVTGQQIGSGVLGLGSGVLGLGNGTAAAPLPLEAAPHCRAQDLIDLWNATTKPPIPRCRELTDDRRRKIRARLAKRPSLTEWRQVFEAIQNNAFCCGQNDRGWVADFDYVIKNDTVAAKALERAASRPVEGSTLSPKGQQSRDAMARVVERLQQEPSAS